MRRWFAGIGFATGLLAACATTQAPPGTAPGLAGTSWQLVKFQGGDDTTLVPDDGTRYTIEFGADGALSARIDCNGGRGTWTSPAPGRLQLGPLALTRALCPPGSLHDRIVKHWEFLRSYVLRDGHLFLSLMADGGIYEFEPALSAATSSSAASNLGPTRSQR
jgi:para-nitrobenzyl esterase